VQPVACWPKVAWELKFCSPHKISDQILKEALWFWKGIANLPWGASELFYPQSLTHGA